MSVLTGANLLIDGYDSENFRFKYLQYQESVMGKVPRIKAGFVAAWETTPLEGEEISMTLYIQDNMEYRLHGFITEIEFGDNYATLYILLIPKDTLFLHNVNKFQSPDEVIKSLYWSDVEGSLSDSTPITLHQMNESDLRTLNKTLMSMKSRSCFAYNMNRLRLTDLESPKVDYIEDGLGSNNYYVDEQNHKKSVKRQASSAYDSSPVGNIGRSISTYDKFSVNLNSESEPLLDNMVTNLKNILSFEFTIRVTFKYYPPYQSGDIVSINIKGIDYTEFLVLDKQMMISDEITISLLLAAI